MLHFSSALPDIRRHRTGATLPMQSAKVMTSGKLTKSLGQEMDRQGKIEVKEHVACSHARIHRSFAFLPSAFSHCFQVPHLQGIYAFILLSALTFSLILALSDTRVLLWDTHVRQGS